MMAQTIFGTAAVVWLLSVVLAGGQARPEPRAPMAEEVFKNVQIAGGRRIQLRAEGFNITNHVNLGLPATAVFNSGGRVSNAGEITTTIGTARQFQFGVKVEF